jgi:hypothetical protein
VTDRDHVLSAILAAAEAGEDDTLSRLALADILDESGDETGLADLIRWGLRRGHWRDFPDPFAHSLACSLVGKPGGMSSTLDHPKRSVEYTSLGLRVLFLRGMPYTIECPRALWRDRGPAIVAAWPIVRVGLSDLNPHEWAASETWSVYVGDPAGSDAPWTIPEAWHDIMVDLYGGYDFSTPEAARLAAGEAALGWARAASGRYNQYGSRPGVKS